MSLQFNGHGTREGVLKKLSELHPPPVGEAKDDKLPHGSDRSQVETLRAAVASEVSALPTEVNGVRVIAEGIAHANARTIMITIIPSVLSV